MSKLLSAPPAEGPCLIHSMNGDLLRTLEGPERCLRPRLLQSSSEGHCMIYYDRGHFCLFSVNGKLLGHKEVDDSVKVSVTAPPPPLIKGFPRVGSAPPQRNSFFSSTAVLSSHIASAAVTQNIPELWSAPDTSTISCPPPLPPFPTFPPSVAGATPDSSYRLCLPDPLFPVWPGKR